MKILISAGPTREYLDPIRYISNPSTGKMGYTISEMALKAGYEVILVSGPVYLDPPKGVTLIKVEKAEDMKDKILQYMPQVEVLIMSAAVGDWRPFLVKEEKIKRKKEWLLRLVPTPDILLEVSKIKKEGQIIIGFALETSNLMNNAKEKLKKKKLDLIVADTPAFFNKKGVSRGAFIYSDGRVEEFLNFSREEVASKLIKILNNYKK